MLIFGGVFHFVANGQSTYQPTWLENRGAKGCRLLGDQPMMIV